MFRSISDWSWVLFAYFCGKVLRIKKYRPICAQHYSGADLVRFSFPITAGRLTKLMRLWGYSQVPVEVAEALLTMNVSWDDAKPINWDGSR